MSDLDPDVIVLTDDRVTDASAGEVLAPRPAEVQAPGATAVFQGMLSVLGEELERLHRGAALLREAVAGSQGETAAALAQLERSMSERITAVESGVARQFAQIADRLPALPGAADHPDPDFELAVRHGLSEIETRLSRLEASAGVGRAEATTTASRLEQAAASTREHLARLEAGVQAVQDAPPFAARAVVENLSPVIEDVNDRVSRLEEALSRLVEQADLRSTTLASELQGVLATGMERLASLASRTDETTAAELQGVRTRVEAIASSLAGLAAEVTGIAEVSRRLVDEGRARPVLEAIDAATREQGEMLSALHASITRRVDARGRALGEMVDALSGPLSAVAGLAPGLQEVGQAIVRQQAALERTRSIAEEVATSVGAVPGGLAGALGRQEAVLEQVRAAVADRGDDGATLRDAVAGLESSIGRSLEAVRSYLGEGLMHVSRRQAGTGKAMESAAAALQSMERQLNGLAGLCQSLASGVEQQTGASARVADLVLETRAALRSDVDRLEATVHLESLKLHQQDQARLAGAASATTEVVEREAALLAQRVSAVAAAVESVRSVLYTHVEDASRGAAAPLALVKDN